jgi:hypothetical protein
VYMQKSNSLRLHKLVALHIHFTRNYARIPDFVYHFTYVAPYTANSSLHIQLLISGVIIQVNTYDLYTF